MKDEEWRSWGLRVKKKNQEVWAKQEYTKTQRSRFEIKNKDQITKSQESGTKSERPKPRVKDQEVLVKNHRPRTRTQRAGFKTKTKSTNQELKKVGWRVKLKSQKPTLRMTRTEEGVWMTRTEEGVWMTRNVTSTETHSKGVKEFHHVHEWRIAGSTNDHWYEACWLSVLAISSIIGSQIGETANPEINRNTDKDKGRNIGVFQREELLGSLEVITRCVSRCMIQTLVLSLS